jgi:hypothetical protein
MTATHKHIKWFFFDLGNNYFIDYMDFESKVIQLKDSKEYFMINFKLYDNIKYKTNVDDLLKYTLNKYNIDITQIDKYDINKLYEPENLYDYFSSNILDMILDDINSKIDNNIDMVENVNKIKSQILTIPIFESSNTRYVCICNFNKFLSKCLSLVKPFKEELTPIYHLICLTSGIKDSSILKVNGYSFNLMKSLWYKIKEQTQLLMREYIIDKMKITLGSFIYSIQNKFPDFYIVFNSSHATFDIRSSKFITYFKSGEHKKSKLAKRINKYKNKDNEMVKKYNKIRSETVNNLTINLDCLSLNEKQKKKITKKCIPIDYVNTSLTEEQSIARKDQIHNICKFVTGSKHCYYSGYKDMLKDFEGFCLNQNKSLKTFKPINDSMNDDMDDDMNDNMDYDNEE